MLTSSRHSLVEVADGLLKPLNKSELKLAHADLQRIGKSEPDVAEMLKAEGGLRDFITAALTLSPYLRDIANIDTAILATAISEPLEPPDRGADRRGARMLEAGGERRSAE